jgi:hypothetical protein
VFVGDDGIGTIKPDRFTDEAHTPSEEGNSSRKTIQYTKNHLKKKKKYKKTRQKERKRNGRQESAGVCAVYTTCALPLLASLPSNLNTCCCRYIHVLS